MIDDGIVNGVYKVTEDKTVTNLKLFKDFLYKNFNNYKKYDDIVSTFNQPTLRSYQNLQVFEYQQRQPRIT